MEAGARVSTLICCLHFLFHPLLVVRLVVNVISCKCIGFSELADLTAVCYLFSYQKYGL